ncbi:MAG TPA: TetR/AcrR family transcriptional regulator, partial [Allosphingosinicella sp.]
QDQSKRMREEAREAILAAAMDVFGERGFGGATTAEVAAAAGVSKGLVFNYFPTKDALLQALVAKALGEALDYWEAQSWEGPAQAQLAQLLDGAIAQVCARPNFYRLYFSLVLQPGGSSAVEAAVAGLKRRLEAYYGRIGRLMGELGSPAADLDAKLFQFALNGLAHTIAAEPLLIDRPDLLPIETLKGRLLARFLPEERHP